MRLVAITTSSACSGKWRREDATWFLSAAVAVCIRELRALNSVKERVVTTNADSGGLLHTGSARLTLPLRSEGIVFSSLGLHRVATQCSATLRRLALHQDSAVALSSREE